MFLPSALCAPGSRPAQCTKEHLTLGAGRLLHAGPRSLGSRSQSRLTPCHSCFQDKPCTDRGSAHECQHSKARQVNADGHQEEIICFGGTMSSMSQTHQALGKASGGVTPGAPKHHSQPYADSCPSQQWEQDHSGCYRDPSPSLHMALGDTSLESCTRYKSCCT